MLIKIAVLLALVCVLCRWAVGKWPWQYMENAPSRAQALRNARDLLEVEASADRAQILAAHKRRIAMVHPDRGGSNVQVHQANDARDLLLAELPPAPPKAGETDPERTE